MVIVREEKTGEWCLWSEEDWKGTGGFIPGRTEDCGYLLLEGQGVIPALRSAGSVVQPL